MADRQKIKDEELGDAIFRITKNIAEKERKKTAKAIFEDIEKFRNPYPKNIFRWDNQEVVEFTRGRLNEMVWDTVNTTKEDIVEELRKKWCDEKKP